MTWKLVRVRVCVQSAALLGGSSSSVLTERLLRQNAELTGFVSRLTEEKNDLRNQLLRLEDELRRLRQRGLGSDSVSAPPPPHHHHHHHQYQYHSVSLRELLLCLSVKHHLQNTCC